MRTVTSLLIALSFLTWSGLVQASALAPAAEFPAPIEAQVVVPAPAAKGSLRARKVALVLASAVIAGGVAAYYYYVPSVAVKKETLEEGVARLAIELQQKAGRAARLGVYEDASTKALGHGLVDFEVRMEQEAKARASQQVVDRFVEFHEPQSKKGFFSHLFL